MTVERFGEKIRFVAECARVVKRSEMCNVSRHSPRYSLDADVVDSETWPGFGLGKDVCTDFESGFVTEPDDEHVYARVRRFRLQGEGIIVGRVRRMEGTLGSVESVEHNVLGGPFRKVFLWEVACPNRSSDRVALRLVHDFDVV